MKKKRSEKAALFYSRNNNLIRRYIPEPVYFYNTETPNAFETIYPKIATSNLGWRKNDSYSLVETLEKEGFLTKEVKDTIIRLKLEELIAVKLELTTKEIRGRNRYYLMPLWHNLQHLARWSVLRWALSTSVNWTEAAQRLGLKPKYFYAQACKYGLWQRMISANKKRKEAQKQSKSG